MLEQQVRRMLADPRSESLVTNSRAVAVCATSPRSSPTRSSSRFRRNTPRRHAARDGAFIGSVFRKPQRARSLTANYTFLNERLARHYGVPNVKGVTSAVTFPDGSVRGVAGASVLTITSYSTRTSPVLRGKWVLENLLSAPPPPPADAIAENRNRSGQAADAARGDDPAPRRAGMRRLPRRMDPDWLRWKTSTPSGDGASATVSSRSMRPACSRRARNSKVLPG